MNDTGVHDGDAAIQVLPTEGVPGDVPGLVRALRESEERFGVLVDLSPDAVLLCNTHEILLVNRRALTIFRALTQDELLGRSPTLLFNRADRLRLLAALNAGRRASGAEAPRRIECRPQRLDGSGFDGEVSLAMLSYRNRRAAAVFVHDITGRKMAERQRHLASIVFETTDEAIMVTDTFNRIVAVNPAFERVTGYEAAEVMGRNPQFLASGRHGPGFYQAMWQSLQHGGHWHGEVWNRRKNGEIYVQRLTLSLIRGADGQVINHVGIFSDITDEMREAERIRYRASYDALTGLPNRSLLHDRLQQALAKAARGQGLLGVLFLDLDGFKPINDRYGHLVGDHVLMALSERLLGCVRESDTVARLGGDEFIVLLPDVTAPTDAQRVAVKILTALAAPFPLAGDLATVRVGVSIGIALYPINGATAEELIDAADRAMYVAKQAGKGRYLFAGGA